MSESEREGGSRKGEGGSGVREESKKNEAVSLV